MSHEPPTHHLLDILSVGKEPYHYHRTRHGPPIHHRNDVRNQGPRRRPELCPAESRAVLPSNGTQGRCDCSPVRLIGSLLQLVPFPIQKAGSLGTNRCLSLHAESVDHLRPLDVGLLTRRSFPSPTFVRLWLTVTRSRKASPGPSTGTTSTRRVGSRSGQRGSLLGSASSTGCFTWPAHRRLIQSSRLPSLRSTSRTAYPRASRWCADGARRYRSVSSTSESWVTCATPGHPCGSAPLACSFASRTRSPSTRGR